MDAGTEGTPSTMRELPGTLAGPRVIALGGAEEPLAIDRDEMLRYLGHTGQEIDADLACRIERIARDVEAQGRARGIFATFPVDASTLDDEGRACIRLTGTVVVLRGRDIYHHLKDARWCTVLACTLGMDNERRLRVLGAQSPLDAAIYDAASSALIEAAVGRLDSMVQDAASAAGLSCNWRFSCGYGDCPLEAQGRLLASLDAARRIGITVTPADLMTPSKSVSAMIGVFEGATHAADAPARCSICRMHDTCSMRKRGTTC